MHLHGLEMEGYSISPLTGSKGASIDLASTAW
jgi:hypothetical protein